MHSYDIFYAVSRLGNAQEQKCKGCSGHNRKCATLRMRESAYLSFTWFQPVTALTNRVSYIGMVIAWGRDPLSKAHIRSINQAAPYLLRVSHWSIL